MALVYDPVHQPNLKLWPQNLISPLLIKSINKWFGCPLPAGGYPPPVSKQPGYLILVIQIISFMDIFIFGLEKHSWPNMNMSMKEMI
jgi:hypothetical protein